MKLDAMEKLFSIQEKIFAENGLNAALEANFHRNQIKSVRFSSTQISSSNNLVDFNLRNSENKFPYMNNTEITDLETFKTVNLEIFPYVKLLTLWRNNCFTNIMKKLQTEKVSLAPKYAKQYFADQNCVLAPKCLPLTFCLSSFVFHSSFSFPDSSVILFRTSSFFVCLLLSHFLSF